MKQNIGRFKKGLVPWNKGKCHSDETKRKISLKNKGKPPPTISIEGREKNRLSKIGNTWNIGRKHSEVTKRKSSEVRIGNKSHFWKGGVSKVNRTERQNIMSSVQYHIWRDAVFKKDDYTCQKTGVRGGYLEAHHMNNYADFPEQRLEVSNGVTLSKKSHLSFHKQYGFKRNTKEQMLEFLG